MTPHDIRLRDWLRITAFLLFVIATATSCGHVLDGSSDANPYAQPCVLDHAQLDGCRL